MKDIPNFVKVDGFTFTREGNTVILKYQVTMKVTDKELAVAARKNSGVQPRIGFGSIGNTRRAAVAIPKNLLAALQSLNKVVRSQNIHYSVYVVPWLSDNFAISTINDGMASKVSEVLEVKSIQVSSEMNEEISMEPDVNACDKNPCKFGKCTDKAGALGFV